VNGSGKGSTGVAERGMGIGLRALNWLAGSDLLDRIRARKQIERALFQGTKNGFRSATVAGRTFKAAQKLTKPARQATGKSSRSKTSRSSRCRISSWGMVPSTSAAKP